MIRAFDIVRGAQQTPNWFLGHYTPNSNEIRYASRRSEAHCFDTQNRLALEGRLRLMETEDLLGHNITQNIKKLKEMR